MKPADTLFVAALVAITVVMTEAQNIPLFPTATTPASQALQLGSGPNAFTAWVGSLQSVWHRAAPLNNATSTVIETVPTRTAALDFIAMPRSTSTPFTNTPDATNCCRRVDLVYRILDETGILSDTRRMAMSPLT